MKVWLLFSVVGIAALIFAGGVRLLSGLTTVQNPQVLLEASTGAVFIAVVCVIVGLFFHPS